MEKRETGIFVGVIAFMIISILIALSLNEFLKVTNNEDLPNLSTLTIEVAVGIVIAIIVFYYSRKNESRFKNTIEDIKKLVEKDYVSKKGKELSAFSRLVNVMENMLSDVNNLISKVEEWDYEKDKKNNFQAYSEFNKIHYHIDELAKKNFKDKHLITNQIFAIHEIENFDHLSEFCENALIIDLKTGKYDLGGSYHLRRLLPDFITQFKQRQERF